MSKGDLDDERSRVSVSPTAAHTAVLAVFVVYPSVSSDIYIERLRSLISAAIDIATVAYFEEDVITLDRLPEWFVQLSDSVSSRGVDSYVNAGLGEPWDPEEWIYCFDPDLRAWSWWDITVRDNGIAVWIDTKGEPHIPHGELLWALYVSGADKVDSLEMEHAAVWLTEHDSA